MRLGFYAQFVSLHIARHYTSSGSGAAATSAIWFMLALLTAMMFRIHNSKPGDSIHPVEYHIVSLQILMLLPLRTLFTPFRIFRLDPIKKTMLRAGARDDNAFQEDSQSNFTFIMAWVLALWLMSLNLWFWWKGLDVMMDNLHRSASHCHGSEETQAVSKWAFFFQRTQIDGWYRKLHKFLSIYSLFTIPQLVIAPLRVLLYATLSPTSGSIIRRAKRDRALRRRNLRLGTSAYPSFLYQRGSLPLADPFFDLHSGEDVEREYNEYKSSNIPDSDPPSGGIGFEPIPSEIMDYDSPFTWHDFLEYIVLGSFRNWFRLTYVFDGLDALFSCHELEESESLSLESTSRKRYVKQWKLLGPHVKSPGGI